MDFDQCIEENDQSHAGFIGFTTQRAYSAPIVFRKTPQREKDRFFFVTNAENIYV